MRKFTVTWSTTIITGTAKEAFSIALDKLREEPVELDIHYAGKIYSIMEGDDNDTDNFE